MNDMTFNMIEEQTTRRYPPAVRVSENTIVRTFKVSGWYVHAELVGHKRRRRQFLIETVRITWTRGIGQEWQQQPIFVTGPTVLSNGEVSTRSTGCASYWDGNPPADIAALAASHHTDIVGSW